MIQLCIMLVFPLTGRILVVGHEKADAQFDRVLVHPHPKAAQQHRSMAHRCDGINAFSSRAQITPEDKEA